MRGLTQILCLEGISKVFNAAISGVSGLGHIAIGVAIIWLLIKVIQSIKTE